METVENTEKIKSDISISMCSGDLNNESLVQIIELCMDMLGMMTISDYSRKTGKTYNGVIAPCKTREIRKIKGVKWVIDNE